MSELGALEQLEQFEKEEYGVPEGDLRPVGKKKEEDVAYVSFLEGSDYLYEEIVPDAELADVANSQTGGVCFVRYSKKDGKIAYVNEFQHKGKTFRPLCDDILKMGGVLLPTGIREYKNTKEITDQIKNYFSKRIELPKKPINFESFLPHLILFYWMYEQFPFIPYVHFVGGTSTGKTTAMEVFGSLCYKPIDTSSSLTIAAMFRIATRWKGTLLVDEFEKVGEGTQAIILFLKAGVSNRLLYRVEGDKLKEIVAYVIKSPKVFTSEAPVDDAGLQSRILMVKMEKNTRELPLYMLEDDYKEAREIRNKLLLWRLRNFNKVDLRHIRFGFPELKCFDRRVQQILTPVYYFSEEDTRKDILEFAKEQETETLRARKDALDGVIFEILLERWDKEEEVKVATVTSVFNEESKSKGYKNEFTEKRIGNI